MFDPKNYGEAIFAFRKDAEKRYPEEACGFITATGYVACPNVADNPLVDFAISPLLFLRINATTPVLAIVHSHPKGMAAPTATDMRQQMATALPWGVCAVTEGGSTEPVWWGDAVPKAPLLGRPFVSGVWDCYSLCRDYYAEKGLTLPDYPRDYQWWKAGGNLYDLNWEAEGFVDIPASEAREGDAFFLRIRSDVTNHAGIYLGGGIALHHLQERLSAREGLNRWAPRVNRWLRHKSMG
jgi:cell wall-associated NlpC family hydrolase